MNCETCGMEVGSGVSYYEGVYYRHDSDVPRRARYCSLGCLIEHVDGAVRL